jgi:hypothetical protein
MLLSPVVIVHTGLQFGLTGWILLGAAFAAAGALMPLAHCWAAARNTPPAAADAHEHGSAIQAGGG